MENSPKILICKPSSLGDIIHALPVLRHIKRAWPQAQVYWWVNTGLASILEEDPDLMGVIHFDRRAWGRLRQLPRNLEQIRRIRRMKFDYVLDLQALLRSALFSWLLRPGRLIGLDARREAHRSSTTRLFSRPHPNTHAVDWYLEVLKALKIEPSADFEWIAPKPLAAQSLQARLKITADTAPMKTLLLQPCTRWQSKQWPLEHFISCVKEILERREDIQVYLLGSREDKATGEAIIRVSGRKRVRNLCGSLSLPEMVECIRLGDLMLTADTGPMHVAAALKKPLVALFGATNPYRTGPYEQLDSVLMAGLPCSPCLRKRCPLTPSPKCMYDLAPGRVVEAILAKI